MVKGSAGRRDIVVHADGNMQFIGGTQMIYDSKSKLENYHGDINSTNYKKWMEDLIPNMPLGSSVLTDNEWMNEWIGTPYKKSINFPLFQNVGPK